MEELRAAEKAARAAGDVIARLYGGDYWVQEKSRDNPVTAADLMANRVIREVLVGKFPDDAWLSEEDVDDPSRLTRSRVWIVDPLDGTREFIRGIPEFCVSIGLAVNGNPILGVIYHPLRRELFNAVRGGGARLNGRSLHVSFAGANTPPCILVSRSESAGRLTELGRDFIVKPMGSIAYRLASVARGDADSTVTFRRVKEWDVCAGLVIVNEAGGDTTTGNGEAPLFNQHDPVLQQIVAGSDVCNAKIRKVLAQMPTS